MGQTYSYLRIFSCEKKTKQRFTDHKKSLHHSHSASTTHQSTTPTHPSIDAITSSTSSPHLDSFPQSRKNILAIINPPSLHDSDSLKSHDAKAILLNVKHYLDDLIAKNSSLRDSKHSPNTKFDAIAIPDISIKHYFDRLVNYLHCSFTCYLLAIVYMKKLCSKNPRFVLDLYNGHRVILLSCILAIKYLDDNIMMNSYYSKVGGISLLELNKLETRMLQLIDYDLYVPEEVLRKYLTFFSQSGIFHVGLVQALPF